MRSATSTATVSPVAKAAGTALLGMALTAAMTATSLFQYLVGVLAPDLRADLGLSRAGVGAITTCYYLVAAFASAPLGRRITAIGSRIGLFLLFALGAVGLLLAAALPAVVTMVVAGILAGIATGIANPVTNMVIVARDSGRGVLIGMKQSGVQLASVVVGLLAPPLSVAFGWRGALAWLAGASLVAGLIIPALTPKGRATSPDVGERTRLPTAVRWLGGYALFMGAGMSTFHTYLVLYGHDQVDLDMTTAGLLVVTFGGIGALVRFVSSVLAERGRRLELWMLFGAFIAVAGVVVFAATHSLTLIVVGVVLVGASGAAWNGVVMLAVLRLSGPGQTGHATGAVLTGFFLGLSLAPPAFGALVDATGSYGWGWTLTGTCFAVAGVLMTVASWRAKRIRRTSGDDVLPVPPA
jgi:predicted MFS family arabinose efflux permease